MYPPKYHPTCHNLSLTVTVKIVAFFDMIFGLFGLVWFVLMLSRYDLISLDPFENIADNSNSSKAIQQLTPLETPTALSREFAVNHKVINLSLVAFYTIVNLSVFVLLLVGVYKKSPGICLVWFYIRCAIFVFKAIILVMYLIGGRPLYSQVPFIISMLAHLYGLWVVNCYVDELNANHQQEIIHETEERVQNVRENSDIYDIPNGIEGLQRKRIEEGLNFDNNAFVKPAQDEKPGEHE